MPTSASRESAPGFSTRTCRPRSRAATLTGASATLEGATTRRETPGGSIAPSSVSEATAPRIEPASARARSGLASKTVRHSTPSGSPSARFAPTRPAPIMATPRLIDMPLASCLFSAGHRHRLPLRGVRRELGMRDDEVPHDGLEPLGLGRHEPCVDRRDDDARVREARHRPTVATDDARDARPALSRKPHGLDEIDADVALDVAASDREHEQAILSTKAGRAEPVRVGRGPALVVDPGGELGDVVRDGVRLDLTELAEVAGCVGRVPRAPTRAAEEQPAAPRERRIPAVSRKMNGLSPIQPRDPPE